MNFPTSRFFPFLYLATVLCLTTTLSESVQAQEGGNRRINVFDSTNRNTIRREVPVQRPENEEMDKISRSLQKAFVTETGQKGRLLLYYGIFLGIVAVLVAGFVGWQMWKKRRKVKELTDPMFLVSELNSAHQLSNQERRLMQEVSEQHSLSSPLKLFVEPEYLLDAWSSETFATARPTIQQLLTKLFDISKA